MVVISEKPVEFEEAIAATGFGRFNVCLMLVTWPCCMAAIYESASISYIIPTAECDLQLSLMDKGILNAVSYAGMITSAIPWGYYADRLGRRQLLICGLLLDSLCMFSSSLIHNVFVLMFLKYLGGLIMCGPFALLMSYVSEFHGMKYRPTVMMIIGMFFSLATISLPTIGWLILPIPWSIHIASEFTMRSWQMYLAICALPSFIGAMGLVFLPESPRFLLSNGHNSEALDVLRTIYSWNTGKPKSNFPITQLVVETVETTKPADDTEIVSDATRDTKPRPPSGLVQIVPLLHKPLLGKAFLAVIIQFCALFGLNTMRLWLPQLYTMVTNTYDHGANNVAPNLCSMIEYSVQQSVFNLQSPEWVANCSAPDINDAMYLNTIYSGFSGLVGYVFAGFLIKSFGTRNVIVCGLWIVGCCGIGMFWATNTLVTVVLSSIYVSLGSICTTAFLGVVVNLFPTSLRTLMISLSMMAGRIGALIGNVVFPYLLSLGCLPPFLLLGSMMLVSGFLCMALPKSNTIALK